MLFNGEGEAFNVRRTRYWKTMDMSDRTVHRSERSSSRYLPTPGHPQESASASASPLLAPHGTNCRG
jgi:hypothetical protein